MGERLKVSGVDVGEEGLGSAAEDGADGGEEAERSGDDGVCEGRVPRRADSGGGEGEPEGVGSAGAADGVGGGAGGGGGVLEAGDLGAEDEMLGVADGFDGSDSAGWRTGGRNRAWERVAMLVDTLHGISGGPRRGPILRLSLRVFLRWLKITCRSPYCERLGEWQLLFHGARHFLQLTRQNILEKGDRHHGIKAGTEHSGHFSQHSAQG